MVVLWIKRPDGFGRGMLRAGVVVHRCVIKGVRVPVRGRFRRNQRVEAGRHHESQHKQSEEHPHDTMSHVINMGACARFRNAFEGGR
ncbi:MAG: hypothetical protein FD175_2499 [Beijerinckiaceae bacterium]|nr:MAG: hypothetical protein FD175_2499 [Beijerinckiaceae bacterium]